MGGELYRYTLDEYKAMVQERDKLLDSESSLNELLEEVEFEENQPLCYSWMEDWKSMLRELAEPDAEWQGQDAESYRSTAWSICNELTCAMEDYETGVRQARNRVRERINELIWMIADCEENLNMTLGGNIVVQTGLALGIEVK